MNIKNIICAQKYLMPVVAGAILLGACVNDNLVSLSAKKSTDSTSVNNSSSSSSNSPSIPTVTPIPSVPPGTGTGTTGVTYSTDIRNLMSKYQCANCHGGTYSSYQGVSSMTNSGILYGCMSGSPGYRRMPPGQVVTAAELQMIKTWIAEGTPNN
jgi:hypothetical protein